MCNDMDTSQDTFRAPGCGTMSSVGLCADGGTSRAWLHVPAIPADIT